MLGFILVWFLFRVYYFLLCGFARLSYCCRLYRVPAGSFSGKAYEDTHLRAYAQGLGMQGAVVSGLAFTRSGLAFCKILKRVVRVLFIMLSQDLMKEVSVIPHL